MNPTRNFAKIKIIFASLFFFLIAAFTNAQAAINCEYDPNGTCAAYKDLYIKDLVYGATLSGIESATASGKPIDWEQIAAGVGLAYTTPDDVLNRLNQMYEQTRSIMSDKDLTDWYQDGQRNMMVMVDKGFVKNVEKALQTSFDTVNTNLNSIKASPVPDAPVLGDDKNAGNDGDKDNNNNPPGNGNTLGNDNNTGSFFDVSYMLSQIEKQIPALIRLVMAIGYLSGFIMIVMAVMKLKSYGQQTVMSSQNAHLGPSIAYFVFGTILMFLPSMVGVATNSVMPESGDVAYEYAVSASGIGYAQLFSAIVAIIRLVGYIAFLRGWLILSKTGSQGAQPGNLGKGIIHVIGGILAINIITTWEIVRASFGFVW